MSDAQSATASQFALLPQRQSEAPADPNRSYLLAASPFLGWVVLMAQKLLNINGREHYVCPASGA